MRISFYLFIFTTLLFAAPVNLSAGPISQLLCSVDSDRSSGNMSLASLSVGDPKFLYPDGVNPPQRSDYLTPGARASKQNLIRVAGRCGSSDYYCSSPGFLYCCGNSTDGFYCAADVNGC